MVVVAQQEIPAELCQLLAQVNFQICPEPPPEAHLVFTNDQLRFSSGHKGGPLIVVDLKADIEKFKRQRLGAKKDILCRAVGIDKNPQRQIIDGTLGLGKDAAHLLAFGAQVVGVEKDPLTWLLVADGRRRLPEQFVKNFQIHLAPTEDYLRAVNCRDSVLYLDPMFTETQKKSLPKKGMAFLRSRQPAQPEMAKVLAAARASGIKRIVVKRPVKGEHLDTVPSYQIAGNLVRYDIYLNGED